MADKGEDVAPGLEKADVVTKYKEAGDMASSVYKQLAAKCIVGASVRALCIEGDSLILEATGKAYNKKVDGKAVEKGVGFPTCLSVNHIICHHTPLDSDPDVVLADGDMVKIDLGVHLDGYIAVVAGTHVVGATKENPVTGRKADAIMAAYNASEIALRMIRPGGSSKDITDAIQAVTADFDCRPIEGMISHQITRNTIDGEKQIIQNPAEAHRKEHKECTFEVNEVYGIDVIATTGDGKSRQSELRTTVFKRTDAKYSLKMKASRALYSEVQKKFTTMPFSLRACEDETKARVGMRECRDHKLLNAFDILTDRDDAFVAQFKLLCLCMPNGNLRATNVGFDAEVVTSELAVSSEDHKKLLTQQITNKAKKKNKKKAKAPAADATPASGSCCSGPTPCGTPAEEAKE